MLAALVALSPCAAQPSPPAGSADGAPAGTPSGTAVEADVLFRFPVGGVVSAGPAIAAGRAWLLSDSKTLYVLTIEGVAIGKRAMAERRSAFISCDAYGRAAVSSGATGIALLNKAGREVWRAELGAAPSSAPVFASDGRLFVAAGSALRAFAPNGKRLWSTDLGSAPGTAVAVGPGGGPAIGLADGTALLFSPDGGPPAAASLGSAPAILASSVSRLAALLSDGRLLVLERDGEALRPVSGGSGGSGGSGAAGAAGAGEGAPRLGSGPVSLAASPEGFYALGTDGTLLAVDGDGRERWRNSIGSVGSGAALAAFAGRVVVSSRTAVRSYGSDGSLYRTLRLTNAASSPAIAPSGAVFAGGADWILYAYRFERALVAGDGPAVASLGLEAVDAAAAEESRWSLAPYDDDAVMRRLYDIEKNVESGTIGDEATASSLYSAAVALGRLDAPFGSGASASGPAPSGPLPRVYACGLLGAMGLPRAVPILVEVFERDPDPAVRAAAASAVAAIGLDPEGRALGAFARAAEGRLDARSAGAVVDAIDGLYRASGALDDRSGLLALVRIAGGDYPRELRSKAQRALTRVSRNE